jgi:NDP-sugar pyrophosphorylase family protein
MEPNLVVLAAGISSRMKKAASIPLDPALEGDATLKAKSMIGVGEGGRPFLDYLLYNARRAGYQDVVIVVGEHDSSIRDHYGPHDRGNTFHGLSISYAIQRIPPGRTRPMGTADALLQGICGRPDWEGQRFTVVNSDNLYSECALRLLRESPAECSMIDYDRSALEFPPERAERYAVLRKARDGSLIEIVEKPSPGEIEECSDPDGRVGVSMNIFRFRKELIEPCLETVSVHPVRQEKELPSAVSMMVKLNPGCLLTIPRAEHVPDLTARDDIAAVQAFLNREFKSFSWS